MSISKRHWGGLVLALLTLLVTACGDSNSFNSISGQPGNPGPVAPVFPGSYLGAANLGALQTSVLDLDVANDGTATGTFTVSDRPVMAQAFTIANGIYNVVGQVDLAGGTFSLTGTIPGLGNFSITGTLPVGNALGSYVVTINGQTFNGNIQNSSLGVPTPPNQGGGNQDGDSRVLLGGVLSDFVFTPDGAYNGVNPPVGPTSIITGAVLTNSDAENLVTISISEPAGTQIRALVFGIVLQDGQQLQVGQSYTIVDSADRNGALLSLSESTGPTVDRGWVATQGSTGTVTILSLDDEGIEIAFDVQNVIPNTGVAGNPATGSFAVSGTVTADFAPLLP